MTSTDYEKTLSDFLNQSLFAAHGGIVTDLDGTVVHEVNGRAIIPEPVELALQELYELGWPVMINSLRFPLSLLRTFGREWYRLANAPIPVVCLNGSQIGYIELAVQDELVFKEIQ